MAAFFTLLEFDRLTRLCFGLLARGHLIVVSVVVPFAIWLIFHALIPSFGLFNVCLTSGNQCTQLNSKCAKHSSHSVTLQLSCLCVSSFARLNMQSTRNNNLCLLSRYSSTRSIKLLSHRACDSSL